MRLDLPSIPLLAAVVLFVLAAFTISLGSIGLTALGSPASRPRPCSPAAG
jgi:hypothetical protein